MKKILVSLIALCIIAHELHGHGSHGGGHTHAHSHASHTRSMHHNRTKRTQKRTYYKKHGKVKPYSRFHKREYRWNSWDRSARVHGWKRVWWNNSWAYFHPSAGYLYYRQNCGWWSPIYKRCFSEPNFALSIDI